VSHQVDDRVRGSIDKLRQVMASKEANDDAALELRLVSLSALEPDEKNHRGDIGNRETDSPHARQAFRDLVESIRTDGLRDAIKVLPTQDPEKLKIRDGHRRYFACLEASVDQVHVLVRRLDESSLRVEQLISNVMQERPNPYEIALAIKSAVDAGVPQRSLARAVGKSEAWVSMHTALFDYPEAIQRVMRQGLVRNLNLARQLRDLQPKSLDHYISLLESGGELALRGKRIVQKGADDQLAQEASPAEEAASATKPSKRAKPLLIEFSPEQAERILRHLEKVSPEILEAAARSVGREPSNGIPDRSQNAKTFRKLFVAVLEKLAPGVRSSEATSKAGDAKRPARGVSPRPAVAPEAQA